MLLTAQLTTDRPSGKAKATLSLLHVMPLLHAHAVNLLTWLTPYTMFNTGCAASLTGALTTTFGTPLSK
jgi:hypothetical protein